MNSPAARSRLLITLLLLVITVIAVSSGHGAWIGNAQSGVHLPSSTISMLDDSGSEDPVYRLKVRLTTTSDWTSVALEGATMAAFSQEIREGADARDLLVRSTFDLKVGKKAYDETNVVVDFEVYLADIQRNWLNIIIEKGNIGGTTVELFNFNGERPQPEPFMTLTHQGISGAKNNARSFTVLSTRITQGGPIALPDEKSFRKRVLAFYYPWYGTPDGPTGSWRAWDTKPPPHTPQVGFYDSMDEATVARHIDEALAAGIDGFITSWWGIGDFTDRALQDVILPLAEREEFRVTLYYERATSRQQLLRELRHILRNYADSPAFLKVKGRPVIFIFKQVTQRFDEADWAFVFEQLRQDGLRCFCVGDGLAASFTLGHGVLDYLFDQFSGAHTYIPTTKFNIERTKQFNAANALRAKVKGDLFAATVAPGFDNSPWAGQEPYEDFPIIVVNRQNGDYYRQMWEAAQSSSPDWILITSFNEWHEGTEIEPSEEFGRQYLRMTRELAERWKAKMPRE